MVNVKKMAESKYLSGKNAGEYKGKVCVINAAFIEIINDEDKVVVRLEGVDKPLPLNHTNLSILFAEYGEDTDMWVNNKVQVNIVKTKWQGNLVDSIQLSPIK